VQDKIIEVEGLSKRFKDILAVQNLNLNVYRGDVFGFLGPNGAGKSTTIRMLLSLIKPTKGSIKIFDKSLLDSRENILKNIGAIVEKPDLYKYLSAYKNLQILGKLSGVDITKKRIMEILELVGLKERANSKVKTFSHGMKQRLGIAQALLHNPELIILDEPTTGLDPQGMKEIRDLINHLSKDEKKTIFLSSHILSEVEQVANRMIIINKGTTVVEGKVAELLDAKITKVTFDVDNIIKTEQLIKDSQWIDNFIKINENSFSVSLPREDVHLLNKYLVENKIEVNSIVPLRSLEEYFLNITANQN
jgi:ABC-type multidrug transport system ATPase subunit